MTTLDKLFKILSDIENLEKTSDDIFYYDKVSDRLKNSLIIYNEKVKDMCNTLSYYNPIRLLQVIRKETEDEQSGKDANESYEADKD